MSRWYRAYVGTVSDDKIAEASLISGASRCVTIAIWHAILESAACDNNGGLFSTTARRVAATLQERCETVLAVFAALIEIGMIKSDLVCDWARYRDDGRLSPIMWDAIRSRIFARDDYACHCCGERGKRLECDHVFPVSRGGSNEDGNLVAACIACNRSKGRKTLAEWRQ